MQCECSNECSGVVAITPAANTGAQWCAWPLDRCEFVRCTQIMRKQLCMQMNAIKCGIGERRHYCALRGTLPTARVRWPLTNPNH